MSNIREPVKLLTNLKQIIGIELIKGRAISNVQIIVSYPRGPGLI